MIINLSRYDVWLYKRLTHKMHHYCDIADVNASINPKMMIQGKITVKSDLLLTKHNTEYFWCILSDKNNKYNVDETEPNEIKIMFWHPFAVKFYKLLERGKVYDFKGFNVKKTNRQYHEHSYQLTATEETMIKEKQMLNFTKKGILFNVKLNPLDAKLQINIKNYFQPS